MESLDLDINNYNLDELLNLFRLDYTFNEDDLKNAKKIALKTHPDRSNLDMKYFIFFKKAYKSLANVYYFRQKRKERAPAEYSAPKDENNAELLHSLNGKSVKEFNSWFNDMFEKVKVNDDENDHGYEEWYKKGEIEKQRKVHLSEFGREFEKKKQQCKSVVVHKGIQDIDSKSGYSLTREKPQEYSSSIFSKLQYEDLKKAHTESVVPVTRADFDNKPKFASIDSYIQHREQQSTTPLSLQQANKYLSERTTNDNKQSMQRAFALIKRDQAVEKSNNDWWQNFKTLKN
jgi:hypothetical protein|tara:strand:- start:2368 stop:3234 length:867 start_codon:yes stop_codon:yes gene_type:complete